MKVIHFLIFFPSICLGCIYILNKFDFKNKRWFFAFYFFSVFSILYTLIRHTSVIVFFFYLGVVFLLFDLVFFLFKKLKLIKAKELFKKLYFFGVTPLILAFIITAYGIYHATHPVIDNYNLTISKELEDDLKIAFVSDIHLGTAVFEDSLDYLVKTVNEADVDLFLLGGDIFDENTKEELKEYAYQALGGVKTTYGTYYIEGNHDLITEKTKYGFTSNGIVVLEDNCLLIDDKFYLVGRRDFTDEERLPLEAVIRNIDTNYPVILLDHQPKDDLKASSKKIDLQLSGHTHDGQIFPFGCLLKRGVEKIEDYELIVSSGYGAWGVPVRTQGDSEIVFVTLKGTR